MTGLSLQPPTRSVMLPSRPRLLSLLTLVFALLSATVAIAQPDPRVEARAHYQAGVAKYTAAQYDEAVAEFRAAEQLAPSPMNDYNIGLALDHKGDAAGAIAAYRAYLDRAPNAANRADVEAAIAKLKPYLSAGDKSEAAQSDVAFLVALTADGVEHTPEEVRLRFTGDAPLVDGGLIELASGPGWVPEAPLAYKRLRVAERVLDFIEGLRAPGDAVLGTVARFTATPLAAAELIVPDRTVIDEVARATQQDPVAYRMALMGDKHPRHKAAPTPINVR